MTTDLFKLMAEASFVAWRDRMVSTGQAPEVAGSTYADLAPSEQEFAMLHVNAVVAALDAAGWAIVPKEATEAMVRAALGATEHHESYEDMVSEGRVRA